MPPVPLISPDSSSARGWSLEQYRARLGPLLGPWARVTVTTDLSDGFEGARRVMTANLASDFARADSYDDLYVYVMTGSQQRTQRAVASGGHDGPNGVLVLDYPLDGPLDPGDVVEIGVLPVLDYQGISGLNAAINNGLETLPVIQLHQQAASSGSLECPLDSQPWPIMQIGRVFAPRTTGPRYQVTGAELVTNAEQPVLMLPYGFGSGQTFEVELYRPSSSWVRHLGAWGDSSVGLSDDDDQALYAAYQVAISARPFALDFLAQRHPRGTPERASILTEAQAMRQKAALVKFYSRYRGTSVQRVGAVPRSLGMHGGG